MRSLLMLTVSAIVLSCAAAGSCGATAYDIYDLCPPGTRPSSKTKINNLGEIVAFEPQQDGGYRMFFYSPVTQVQYHADYIDLSVWAINDRRQVAGVLREGLWPAVLWDPVEGLTDLGTLGEGQSWPASLNENGTVVGAGFVYGAVYHAFYWTRSTGMQDIGTLGGVNSWANGINDTGQVVGASDTAGGTSHAFIWSPGGIMEDLGTLGGLRSEAYGINKRGEVFGVSDIDASTKGLFLWDRENGMRAAFTWSSPDYYAPKAMNDNGTVVGITEIHSSNAFIWDPAAGLSFIQTNAHAYDINNSGQITGVLFALSGNRPVLWNPVPEPSSLLALAAGIGGFGLGLLRKRRR